MNALMLTSIQNDFCAGGALAVPDGGAIVPLANRLIRIENGRDKVQMQLADS